MRTTSALVKWKEEVTGVDLSVAIRYTRLQVAMDVFQLRPSMTIGLCMGQFFLGKLSHLCPENISTAPEKKLLI